MEIIPELRELNLEDNEIKVYLACLSLGSSKVHEIAKKSNLIRTTTYGVLRSLIEKGFVSSILKENITHFQAASPKQLITLLDEKKRKINSVLPQLEKITEIIPARYRVEFFEGKKGVISILNDLLSVPKSEYKVLGTGKKWMAYVGDYVYTFYNKKKEKKIKTKAIVEDTKEERESMKDKKIFNTEIRFKKNFSTDGSIIIYQDKVAYIVYDKESPRGFIVKDPTFVKMQTQIFEQVWKTAKE